MILTIAFHTVDKCLILIPSTITFFALIGFVVIFQVLVFVVFLSLCFFIACLTAPNVPFVSGRTLFQTSFMVIVFAQIALNNRFRPTPIVAFLTDFDFLSGFNELVLICEFQFPFDLIDESMDVFYELFRCHRRKNFFQHSNVCIEVDQEGFWLGNWVVLRILDSFEFLFGLFYHPSFILIIKNREYLKIWVLGAPRNNVQKLKSTFNKWL